MDIGWHVLNWVYQQALRCWKKKAAGREKMDSMLRRMGTSWYRMVLYGWIMPLSRHDWLVNLRNQSFNRYLCQQVAFYNIVTRTMYEHIFHGRCGRRRRRTWDLPGMFTRKLNLRRVRMRERAVGRRERERRRGELNNSRGNVSNYKLTN